MFSARTKIAYTRNLTLAKRLWFGQINREQQVSLKSLSANFGLSIAAGDLQLLENRWYVTHSGLIRLAQRRGCSGIAVSLITEFCEWSSSRFVCKATVYKKNCAKGFVGYGDAAPSNVSSLVRGAELRIAETRAVNRALRKAYGIGLCSVEELGAFSSAPRASATPSSSNGLCLQRFGQWPTPAPRSALPSHPSIQPRFESCQSLRGGFLRHAALSGASHELVESFISHLSSAAKQNRDALVCKLNSYAQPVEATS